MHLQWVYDSLLFIFMYFWFISTECYIHSLRNLTLLLISSSIRSSMQMVLPGGHFLWLSRSFRASSYYITLLLEIVLAIIAVSWSSHWSLTSHFAIVTKALQGPKSFTVVFPESTVKHGTRWIDIPSIFSPHMTQPINECIEQ